MQRQQRHENVDQNADNDINNEDDEQLIDNESETPQNHPYMRASKAVSMERIFHYSRLHSSSLNTISLYRCPYFYLCSFCNLLILPLLIGIKFSTAEIS
jgi:hypothetical protein